MSELFQIQAACPRCAWKPALYAYPAQIQAATAHEPEAPMLSVKCQNLKCRTIYPIAADAFQRATRASARPGRKAA